MKNTQIQIRMTEDEKAELKRQADKLGLDISDYIRLVTKLDAATNIIEMLNLAKGVMTLAKK